MEDYTTRAIFFGVSIFVIMATISLLMTFFNTAKLIAEPISNREDIAESLENMTGSTGESEYFISGTEVRSLVREHIASTNILIEFTISGMPTGTVNNNPDWYDETTMLVNQAMLNYINPVTTYKCNVVSVNPEIVKIMISK